MQAIKFVIANPTNPEASYDWISFRKAQLYVAYRYYRDPAIAARLTRSRNGLRAGEIITYGQITHDFAPGEVISQPTPIAPQPPDTSATGFVTSGGTWTLHDGVYSLSEPHSAESGQPHANTAIYNGRMRGDIMLTTLARVMESGSAFDDVVVIFNYQDARNYAYVSLNERNDNKTSGIFSMVDGVSTELVDITTPIRAGVWSFVQVLKQGSQVEEMIDGQSVATTQSLNSSDGRIGFGTLNNAADFTNVTVIPLSSSIDERFQGAAAPFETSGGTWSQSRGSLSLEDPSSGKPGEGLGNRAIYSSEVVGDFVLGAEMQTQATNADFNDVALIFGYQDAHNYAYVSLNERNDDKTSGVFAVVDGVSIEVADITETIRGDTWYRVRLHKAGSQVEVTLDGQPIATAVSTAFDDGQVGFGTLNDAAVFDNLQLTPATQYILPTR